MAAPRGPPPPPTPIRIGTLNIRGLHNNRGPLLPKLELLLEACLQLKISILLVQETWAHADRPTNVNTCHDLDLQSGLPSGWTLLSAPSLVPKTRNRRRGLMVLCNKALLQQHGLKLSFLGHCSDEPDFEFLLADLGPFQVASVYLPPDQARAPGDLLERLASRLQPMRRDASKPLVIGGDFNYLHHIPVIHEGFADELGLLPLLPVGSGYITRPPQGNSRRGSMIDNLFYSADFQPAPAVVLVAPCIATQSGRRATPLDTDHHLVLGAFTLPGLHSQAAGVQPDPDQPRPRQPARPPVTRWLRLRHLTEDASSADPATAAAASAKLDAIKAGIRAIGAAHPHDLDAANQAFCDLARVELGEYVPRAGDRHPHMCLPSVRQALKPLRKTQKRLLALRAVAQRHPSRENTARLSAASAAAGHARRAWERAREEARFTAHEDLLRQSARATAPHKSLLRWLRKARRVKRANGRDLPYLDAGKTVAYWSQIYTSKLAQSDPDADIATWDPVATAAELEAEVLITPDMVRETIQRMERKAVGPDGLDFLFLQTFADEVAPVLASCFTHVARAGLPEDSPLRVSETLLFYKPKTLELASDPSQYRPITLLPMVIRVLHKLLDLLFRGVPQPPAATQGAAPPQAADPPSVFPPAVEGLFHRAQSAFQYGRGTSEPTFLLHQLQAHCRDHPIPTARPFTDEKGRCGAYGACLDLTKAYDTMEHSVILNHLLSLEAFSRVWVEVLRKLLAGNSTVIMGERVWFRRGLPQGGALCPFLCLAFMDTLAQDLEAHVGPDRFPSIWPRRWTPQVQHFWWLPDDIRGLDLLALLYADDVTLMASDLNDLQALLDVVSAWSQRVGIEISSKSFVTQLSGVFAEDDGGPDSDLYVGDLTLKWVTSTFRYLGTPTSAYHPATCGAAFRRSKVRHDPARLAHALLPLRLVCQLPNGQPYLVPSAARFAVNQVLHASTLFATPFVDLDHTTLGQRTLSTLRSALALPHDLPSAYLRYELRLTPPHLQAAGRLATSAHHLWHHSWIGRELLQPMWTGTGAPPRRSATPLDDPTHKFLRVGPVALWNETLSKYFVDPAARLASPAPGLAWLHAEGDTTRGALRRQINAALATTFRDEMLTAVNALQLPESILGPMRVNINTSGPPSDLPLYLLEGDDLPRAGLLFRAPFLGHVYRSALAAGRPPCCWCGAIDGEWGHHLLSCPACPPVITAQRDAVLRAILADMHPSAEAFDSPVNLQRLYTLTWPGATPDQCNRLPGRSDAGQQPSAHVLRQALWYMRSCINAYSPASPASGKGKRRVRPLRVYGSCPPFE